jgi:hypothetical protein
VRWLTRFSIFVCAARKLSHGNFVQAMLKARDLLIHSFRTLQRPESFNCGEQRFFSFVYEMASGKHSLVQMWNCQILYSFAGWHSLKIRGVMWSPYTCGHTFTLFGECTNELSIFTFCGTFLHSSPSTEKIRGKHSHLVFRKRYPCVLGFFIWSILSIDV